jgi:hypothetical protein
MRCSGSLWRGIDTLVLLLVLSGWRSVDRDTASFRSFTSQKAQPKG